MNRSLLGNILIVTLLILLGSGIVMYFMPHSKEIASLHTVFGLLFLLAMGLHIFNNKIPLKNYITGKRKPKLQKLQAPLVFLSITLIATGVYLNLPLFREVYTFGNEIRNVQLGKKETLLDYEIIKIIKDTGTHHIELELKKGNAFQYPLFAVWLEDSLGNYIETLYVSRVIASSSYDYGTKVNGVWEKAIKRRPEALPYWSHKRGIKASDGLYVPLNNSKDIDAVSGATPTGNFILQLKNDLEKLGHYKVLLEVNQSYDWNAYYSEDKFPNDAIYSGTGKVGQPSLIYTVDILPEDLNEKNYKFMQLKGHGHHSGKDGKLYTDISNITTAKEIVDRAILSIY
ncbi:hypothetical protein RBH94_08500 [Aestuariibaculum sp. YM273]|uniref:DUF4405 domain-containing protein n=1 Tax=Aestuariibaculum sp. YM273 TaxID=3070659 RepID=UPI0027DD4E4D|nr:DUF4405 domain-containing protein [Aestuariibaculum sp. YM273]WMI64110.1 hypothetical protein RBH94_08500 [Aestuariibaculum sp. YM273]